MTAGNRHLPFYLAAGAAAVSTISAVWVAPLMVSIIASNAFFATYLALALSRMFGHPGGQRGRAAGDNDEPAWVIFLITIGAVGTALAALFIVINARDTPGAGILVLAFCAVPLGWAAIHVMAAAHYAHLYWQDADKTAKIEFPRTEEPGPTEFVYFAFVIGMTAQTSDVSINSSEIRAVATVHAIVSFFFNTVLVAAAVNAAVALGN
ncbi:DUF1345 domain-containing protein [Chelativorans sp. ZYF759]|uniref:DUF1345 domain-containing protein n=1 Tax=Chelativorans sp. ZYF759 TaxID=2692213 RepID=UPI0016B0A241|nr:DUF1345 domain-containing protein [Chelativorans sp. ZYF759]NMG38555.1 DUF1345 domain-containing protein [Chelativorans sp. ZYF759]